jgi:hypothetical protein
MYLLGDLVWEVTVEWWCRDWVGMGEEQVGGKTNLSHTLVMSHSNMVDWPQAFVSSSSPDSN